MREALGTLLLVAVAAALPGSVVALTTTTVGAATVPSPAVAAAPGAPATPGAVSVADHGASGAGTADDTAAFAAAMDAALQPGTVRYPDGPGGAPQGVVYVPPGTYRLLNLAFPDNLRLEVDAGAVLAQAGGRSATSPSGYSSLGPSVVLWDGLPGAPRRNVSLVGVGTATGGAKSQAEPVAAGWTVAEDFTFDLDPLATNASNLVSGLMAINVDGFLIANVLSIQNDSQPASVPVTNADWWPSSRKAALGLKSRSDTPVDGSAFYDPHNGAVANWYNTKSPRGFGPNQVNSGHNLALSHIFSQGGTAVRFETDNSNQVKFGAEVRTVTADDIAGTNCNRAVAFAPHFQPNYDVHVTHVRATSCYEGLVEAVDKSIPADRRGGFYATTVSDVVVTGGGAAQLPLTDGSGKWTLGPSSQAFSRDGLDPWAVTYSAGTLACGGGFQWPSDTLQTTAGPFQPACSPTAANPTVPSAPTIGPAVTRLAQATVSFSPAAADGGSPITSYTVTSSPEGRTVTTTTSPVVFTNLTVGTTYTFTVHATNAVGNGPESAPSNPVLATAPPPPDAPTGLVATALSSSRVKLTWNRADRATSYRVLRSTTAGGPYAVVGTPTKKAFTDSHLAAATTYYYAIEAVSSSGVSPPSAAASVTTLAPA